MSETNQSITAENLAPPPLGCHVCSKIVQVLNTPFSEESVAVLGKVHDILAHECGHTNWIRHVKYTDDKVPHYERRVLHLYKPTERRNVRLCVSFLGDDGVCTEANTSPFELVLRPDVPNHKGTARILDKEWIDFSLIKDWVSRCFQEHGAQCDRSPIQGIRPFYPQWLIDVNRGCVVACPKEAPRFVTLSYTWGRTTHFRTTRANMDQVRVAGSLLYGSISTQIPQTIHNAIQLTKALRLAWLWVDSLCVVQDDEASLSHQLRNMHRIYATSTLTIIAQDGQDAEYGLRGLRGVSAPRFIEQLVVPLAGGETVIMMEPEYKYRAPSMFDYEQRMWTFQEKVFAKRRLVFKRGVVGWQCNCANWYEHQPYHSEADSLEAEQGYGTSVCGRLHKWTPSLFGLDHIVHFFNRRTLGFDEDVFNAFSGLHMYMNRIFPSGLVMGHPELFFEISLCWDAGENLRRRKVSEVYNGDPVRDRLPSWSWMGWQGEIYFRQDQEFGSFPVAFGQGFTQAVTNWHALPSPDSTTKHPIESMWHQYRKGMPHAVLPAGLLREEFKPPLEWAPDPFLSDTRFNPMCMPKELPTHAFIHESKEEGPYYFQWYPVPFGDLNLASEDEELDSHREFQFLQCLTTRAYLHGSPEKANYFRLGSNTFIQDKNGNRVGGLRVHHEDDRNFLANGPMIELIAVAKGWTTELERCEELEQRELAPKADIREPSQEEEEEYAEHFSEAMKRENSRKFPWKEQWEREKSMKQDCYYVLWIDWEHGVAYRRGSGFVIADKWEELAELDEVEVTLG